MKNLLLFLSLFSLSACNDFGAFIANLPGRFDNVRAWKDIPYGAHGQRLDLYVPAEGENHPVLVFFYGGRWQVGSKDMYKFIGSRFARTGYAVVISDYRKYPSVSYPAFAQDGAQAVRWAADHAADYGGDPARIYLMGHSSGAHTGAMLAADRSYLEAAGVDYSAIKAFAGLAGPYDFTPEDQDLKAIFGPPERYPAMQATRFVDGSEPPMLLLHGAEDDVVDVSNLEKLAAALEKENVPVETRIYDGVDHTGIVSALTWLFNGRAPVAEDILWFFSRHRHPGG